MTDQPTQAQNPEPDNDDALMSALRLVSESNSLTGQLVPGHVYRLRRACAELGISRRCGREIRSNLIEAGHLIINGSAESVLGSDFQAAMISTAK